VLRASKTVQILDRSFGHLAFIERAALAHSQPASSIQERQTCAYRNATRQGIADRCRDAILGCRYFKAALLFRFASKARWAIIDQLEALSDAYTPRTPENT
jgi:hypothetical protein